MKYSILLVCLLAVGSVVLVGYDVQKNKTCYLNGLEDMHHTTFIIVNEPTEGGWLCGTWSRYAYDVERGPDRNSFGMVLYPYRAMENTARLYGFKLPQDWSFWPFESYVFRKKPKNVRFKFDGVRSHWVISKDRHSATFGIVE